MICGGDGVIMGVVMGVMKGWLWYENDDNDKIYTCSLSTHV